MLGRFVHLKSGAAVATCDIFLLVICLHHQPWFAYCTELVVVPEAGEASVREPTSGVKQKLLPFFRKTWSSTCPGVGSKYCGSVVITNSSPQTNITPLSPPPPVLAWPLPESLVGQIREVLLPNRSNTFRHPGSVNGNTLAFLCPGGGLGWEHQ